MTIADARDHLSEVINRAAFGKEPIILTCREKPLAAVVPLEYLEWAEDLREELEDREDARRARDEAERVGTIPWTTIKAESNLE